MDQFEFCCFPLLQSRLSGFAFRSFSVVKYCEKYSSFLVCQSGKKPHPPPKCLLRRHQKTFKLSSKINIRLSEREMKMLSCLRRNQAEMVDLRVKIPTQLSKELFMKFHSGRTIPHKYVKLNKISKICNSRLSGDRVSLTLFFHSTVVYMAEFLRNSNRPPRSAKIYLVPWTFSCMANESCLLQWRKVFQDGESVALSGVSQV